MNADFKTKLLFKLANKKADKGFTLIELLVVTIIVGILAAIALPNLLNQVGKAREVEAKNGLGAFNRAQQAFHYERGTFANGVNLENDDNQLGIVLTPVFYNYNAATNPAVGNGQAATLTPAAIDAQNNGLRNYQGGVNYNAANGNYNTGICQSDQIAGTATAVNTPGNTITCSAGGLIGQ